MISGGFPFLGLPCCAKLKPSRIMNNLIVLPALRLNPENPNHHLWNNNGTWFLHYTVYPTPFTKERIRRSLGTKDVATARERRDNFFIHLLGQARDATVPRKVAVA